MKVLLVSFVYPIIKPYLKEFFISLNNQTIKDFDTLIFDDDFNEDLKKYGYDGEIIYNKNKLNIFEVRKFIIYYSIQNNYDLLIFADADDVMANDRVQKIIEAYDENVSFFYNNLYLLSDIETDFYKGELPNETKDLEEIKEYNFLGMSHTAINIRKERDILSKMPITDKMIAFDWYMHSYLLLHSGCGKKVSTKTYYRIYENNTAGFTNYLTDKKLNTGLKVKKYHYAFMKQFDKSYKQFFNRIIELEKKLTMPEFRKKYIEYINRAYLDSVFWWENIRTLDNIKGGLWYD